MLSRPWWLAAYRDGLPVRKQSPIQVVTGPVSINFVEQSQRANHYTKPPPCRWRYKSAYYYLYLTYLADL